MLRPVLCALALWLPAAVLAAPAPPPLPVPPIVDRHTQPERALLGFAPPPPAVTCAEGAPRRLSGNRFSPAPSWMPAGEAAPRQETFLFRIDPSGRPLGIRAATPRRDDQTEPLEATLAAWRFEASNAGFTGCAYTVEGRVHLPTLAPADLLRQAVAERTWRGRDEWRLRQLIGSAGCGPNTAPAPRITHHPDYAAVQKLPGRPQWSLESFDVSTQGRPHHVVHIADSGAPDLRRRSERAVRASRWESKEAVGCLMTYYAPPAPLPAPPMPQRTGYERPGDSCEEDVDLSFRTPIPYPKAAEGRRIEGWALMRFDVAPWGEVGSIEVLASEPTSAFGLMASNYLRMAKASNPSTGRKGCIVPVRFKLPELMTDAGDAED
ncbi:energy transducer TonB [Phenylobacterium deserti]|uniref:TonB C-terminal domain-containing protein n=1 Tax=Phenylobacterium deserti TaxID=1914756 RepID=A0A328AEJ9_9CAUL|nr:energy transducer TonB [Phenylobacterium deserti]RAK52917.1 hypothetical protein DJ018_12130 [Phenylobacterium deserti]